MVRNQALAFVPCNPDAYFNARSSASCTMSSASASLRESQRARLYAEFRCGSTSSAQRDRASPSGNRTSIHAYRGMIGTTGFQAHLFPSQRSRRSQLYQRAQHPGQVLDHLERRRTLSPARQRQHLPVAQITRLFLPQALPRASVVEQDDDFRVERKGANVEVRGSDPRDLIIDRDVFRMQETLAVAADAHARAQQLVVVGSLAQTDQDLVHLQRHHERYLDPTQHRRLQRLQQSSVRY